MKNLVVYINNLYPILVQSHFELFTLTLTKIVTQKARSLGPKGLQAYLTRCFGGKTRRLIMTCLLSYAQMRWLYTRLGGRVGGFTLVLVDGIVLFGDP